MGTLNNLSVLKGTTSPLKPTYIHKLFEKSVQETPKNIAVLYEDQNITIQQTYDELNKLSNKIGRCIIDTIKNGNIGPNQDGDYIIAVSMLPTDRLVSTLLGIWKSGCSYLPIDQTFPKSRVEHILNEAKPALVIYENNFESNDTTLIKNFEDIFKDSKAFCDDNIEEKDYLKHKTENLAIVSYTSGSTGVPKGVRIPHEVIQNRLFWQFKNFPFSKTEKICVFKTSLTFIDSVCEIWGPLVSGRTILVVPKKTTQDPEKLVGVLEKYKVERLVLVPSLLRSILLFLNLQKNNSLLKNLKIWVCSGEPLAVTLAQEFFEYFSENDHILCNFYGSTEIMGDVTYYVISSSNQLKNQEKVPIGLPIDNTIIYLFDNELKPVPLGSVGELWVSGSNLASGYVNGRDPERFIQNPLEDSYQFSKLYRTGDYAKIVNGTLLYEGRTDSQVKIRGHRVDLSEVEKAVLSLPVIEKGIVLCYHPGHIDQALLAFVTLKANNLLNEIQVENMLRKKLAPYMWPQVIILESIPLLVNGKIDRQTLLKKYETTNNNDDTSFQVDIDYTGVSDKQFSVAKILLETIAEVLNRSARGSINIEANFYEIGGNSLNSILTISKLNDQGYYISISDFIGAQNLREMLNFLSPEKEIIAMKSEPNNYTSEMLKDGHKNDVFQMITDSFYGKADLEQWLMPNIKRQDYMDLLSKIWDVLLAQDLSFVVKNKSEKYVGVSLSLDARDEPEVDINSKLAIVFEFLEWAEGPVRDNHLPQGKGKIFHSSMMATNASLTSKENVSVMQYMEEEVLRIARAKNFVGIFTTNTSPLTQQLGINVYGYQNMSDIQVNKYIASDGTKPFEDAPDDQRAIVSWKPI